MSAERVCWAALGWIIEEFNDLIKKSNESNPFVIGIGSGSTIVPFVKFLSEFTESNTKKPYIVCIPTSEQARHLILTSLRGKRTSSPFRLGTLDEYENVSVTVDGADAVYFKNDFLIKGGGAAHCQEKIIAEASKKYVIVVADQKKIEKDFEEVAVPIEVIPLAVNSIKNLLQEEFGSNLLTCEIRYCPSGCGKIGPIITDNGNLVLDVKFNQELFNDPKMLDTKIRQYAGVVETGIFWRLPQETLIVYPDANGQVNQKLI
jgi:ribose 5-phosphate isomerase A